MLMCAQHGEAQLWNKADLFADNFCCSWVATIHLNFHSHRENLTIILSLDLQDSGEVYVCLIL